MRRPLILAGILCVWILVATALAWRRIAAFANAPGCQGYECEPRFQAAAFAWTSGPWLLVALGLATAAGLYVTRRQ